eukprot:GDKJ01019825.1.p1 GENE.GDKJ01019825.1~~GDKJ01019825.1.p1  ORF type:complete len:146 (+),score=21.39 GDKJ01019825.1:52-438(+)
MTIHPSRIIATSSCEKVIVCFVSSNIVPYHILLKSIEGDDFQTWLWAKRIGSVLQDKIESNFPDVTFYSLTSVDNLKRCDIHVLGRRSGDLPEDSIYPRLESLLKDLDLSSSVDCEEERRINHLKGFL